MSTQLLTTSSASPLELLEQLQEQPPIATSPTDEKIQQLTTKLIKILATSHITEEDVRRIIQANKIDILTLDPNNPPLLVAKQVSHLESERQLFATEEAFWLTIYQGLPIEFKAEQLAELFESQVNFPKIAYLTQLKNSDTCRLQAYYWTHLYMPPEQLHHQLETTNLLNKLGIKGKITIAYLTQMRKTLLDKYVLKMSSRKQQQLRTGEPNQINEKALERLIEQEKDCSIEFSAEQLAELFESQVNFSIDEIIEHLTQLKNSATSKLRAYYWEHLYMTPEQLHHQLETTNLLSELDIRGKTTTAYLTQIREASIDKYVLKMSTENRKEIGKDKPNEINGKILERLIQKDRDLFIISEAIRKEALNRTKIFFNETISDEELKELFPTLQHLAAEDLRKNINSFFNKEKTQVFNVVSPIIQQQINKEIYDLFKSYKDFSGELLLEQPIFKALTLHFFNANNILKGSLTVIKTLTTLHEVFSTKSEDPLMNEYLFLDRNASEIRDNFFDDFLNLGGETSFIQLIDPDKLPEWFYNAQDILN